MATVEHDALTNHATTASLKNLHLPGYSVANWAARDAITTATPGDLCYTQATPGYFFYDGTWRQLRRIAVATPDVTTPPTDAELDSAFGNPDAVGNGFIGILDDNGAGTQVYAVTSDGSNWWYVAMTKAT